MDFTSVIKELANVDIFKEGKNPENFMGRPFYIDYDKANILVCDSWKMKVGGLPHGSFLLAFYEGEKEVTEALLLRVLRPTKLPTDMDIISSMVEYYKDNLKTTGEKSQLDDFTRYEFSFSGLECRILGTFYKNSIGKVVFGADVENFYSSHNYTVFKPKEKVLEFIVNLKDSDEIVGNSTDIKIGKVRYSSSIRFQDNLDTVPIYISPKDFLGKRTALFGMTRTGKSNSVKKIIEATVKISKQATGNLNDKKSTVLEDNLTQFDNFGKPKFPVGQIIFDINGEYANANMQDSGTAIFELFKDITVRYSTLNKAGFKVMKVNFYNDILEGFDLIRSHLSMQSGNYIESFCAIDLTKPENYTPKSSEGTRYDRLKAAYFCCLYKAGFPLPNNFKVTFIGNDELNHLVKEDGTLDPSKGITLEEAYNWFISIWQEYDSNEYFSNYKKRKGKEWADEDLKAALVFLSRKKEGRVIDGYLKLRSIKELHTDTVDKPFDEDIIEELRKGNIIIIDLSQGNPDIQNLYSERISKKIFYDSMDNFIKNKSNNFIQFYFEEAHNLFPKKEDKDLSQIYNRIAKEGAKLNIGMIYATQEVSSISSNILKNTQNWFIAHLNNEDEIKELRKYYDFDDFSDSLIKFSSDSDKGFVRMKTYSNPFVVPAQIDRFLAKE